MFKNNFDAEASLRFWARFTRACSIFALSVCGLTTFIMLCMSLGALALIWFCAGLGAFIGGYIVSALMWGFADLVRKANQGFESVAFDTSAAPTADEHHDPASTSSNPPADAKNVVISNSKNSIKDLEFFYNKHVESIVIPTSICRIGYNAFAYCKNLKNISFKGTVDQWNAIEKTDLWHYGIPATEVICSDGTVSLD